MSKELITGGQLTDMQSAFVHSLVFDGKGPTESARIAGFKHPKQASYLLTRNPKIIRVIRQERQKLYQADLAPLAIGTLRSVMLDPDAPASARVSASRTALELAGDLNKDKGGELAGRSLAELSPDELASMIDRWEEERSSLAKDVTPQGQPSAVETAGA
tara:strand:+ start:1455 stop:1934 length:480 start_codon:yes stop_codon:yes gene_type:complete